MKTLKELLNAEELKLENLKLTLQSQLSHAPEGALRVSQGHDQVQYYWYKPEETTRHGKYIKRSQEQFACQLAQKAYNEKVLKLVEKRLKQVHRLIGCYKDGEVQDVYEKETVNRKRLITPVEPSWEQLSQQWLEEKYEGKGFREETQEIYTDKGERVRSKSEKILADYFFRNGIPYKYEKPLYLSGYGVVYPDFTILSPATWEVMYWEHEGRMDDPTYAKSAVKKLKIYEENGIFVGEKLILTYETEASVLNTRDIERLVKKYLL